MKKFLELSCRYGSDPLLVQGGGGNTSMKSDGKMRVKSSGTWLSEATVRDIFVALEYQPMLEALLVNPDTDLTEFVCPDSVGRPSIETSLHGLIPREFVFHLHSISTLVWAVQTNGRLMLEEKLRGLDWGWVPYRKPGAALARELLHLFGEYVPEILVLQNHGVVVSASNCKRIAELVDAVETALNSNLRDCRAHEEESLPSDMSRFGDHGFDLVPEYRQLALDPWPNKYARGGSMYPDHVVFLAGKIRFFDNIDNAFGEEVNLLKSQVVVVEGAGVWKHQSLDKGGIAMLGALNALCARIPANSEISYLSKSQEMELLNWEAEDYRKALHN